MASVLSKAGADGTGHITGFHEQFPSRSQSIMDSRKGRNDLIAGEVLNHILHANTVPMTWALAKERNQVRRQLNLGEGEFPAVCRLFWTHLYPHDVVLVFCIQIVEEASRPTTNIENARFQIYREKPSIGRIYGSDSLPETFHSSGMHSFAGDCSIALEKNLIIYLLLQTLPAESNLPPRHAPCAFLSDAACQPTVGMRQGGLSLRERKARC